MVQKEFDQAVINLNIPFADFGDKNGANAKNIAEQCKKLITKPGIRLNVTHEFYDSKRILDFLAKNTINVFLYEDTGNRGLSSAIDNAIAVKRPVAISDSIMFRHLFDVEPSVSIPKSSLATVINNGFAPLQKHYDEWNSKDLLWEYERIISAILKRSKNKISPSRNPRSIVKRFLSLPDKNFSWLRNTNKAHEDDMQVTQNTYRPITLTELK